MAPNNGYSPKTRAAAAAGGKKPSVQERAVSFHGRLPAAAAAPESNRITRRPRTQPDLTGRRASRAAEAGDGGGGLSSPSTLRVPTKVLVNVTVQRSLGAVQVIASTDWTISQLVAAAVRLYIEEGRRPLLTSADGAAYGLHYSQFSMECLGPEEKLLGLGSRNFFLCIKAQNQTGNINKSPAVPDYNIHSGLAPPASSCSNEAEKAAPKSSAFFLPWIGFMDFLL